MADKTYNTFDEKTKIKRLIIKVTMPFHTVLKRKCEQINAT